MLDPFSNYSYDRDEGGGIGAALKSTVVLRIGAGIALFFQYALEGTLRSFHFIWNKAAWPVVDMTAAAGVPLPSLVACAAGLGAMCIAIAWMVGYLTRLFSFLALPLLLGAGYVFAKQGAEAHVTACVLFGLIAITLMSSGSGMWSLDRLFKLAAAPKRRKTLF